MTELTPLARKLQIAYLNRAITDSDDTEARAKVEVRWNAAAKAAEDELVTPYPVRLPTVAECHQAIGASCANALVDPASVVLDLVASLNPTWVPVPADATIPAGTPVRIEQDNYASEQTILRDWHGDHRNRKSRFFVPSGTVLTTPEPLIESAARAIYAADQQDGDEQCWDTDTDAIRDTYVKLAKAAAEALGVTL